LQEEERREAVCRNKSVIAVPSHTNTAEEGKNALFRRKRKKNPAVGQM